MRLVLIAFLATLDSTASAAPLALRIGESDIDVATRTIYFELATAADSVDIEVYSLLHVGQAHYEDAKPRARLSVSWPDLGEKGENFRIELKFTDTKGNWVTFQVIRFYLEVPHEEVEFESAKWAIPSAQEEKLKAPLALLKDAAAKYSKLMDVSLYVAGYTDTVGSAADNQALSERRARAIADYFVKHGLTGMPIYARGFGEGALAVQTADDVPEAKNRRALYIVSSFMPVLHGPGQFVRVR
jgi:outer membrane protein OmpA-like peptidoglycan-associated protein